MRKNTKAVYAAWANSQALRKCEAVWTDGEVIYSYHTPIAGLLKKDQSTMVVVRAGEHSHTTSVHCNAIASMSRNVMRVDQDTFNTLVKG